MTVSACIEKLKEMPQDTEVYFDCGFCGRANSFQKVGTVVLLQTVVPIETRLVARPIVPEPLQAALKKAGLAWPANPTAR